MLQFSWIGILKILKEIHLHWNKSGETNVTFNCSPWGCLCVPWQSSMPEHLPHCLPFLNDSYALCPAQRPPLVPLLPTFFPQHLQRWRWQVFMGGAAVPARWSPSNCCLPLLFCAEGLWADWGLVHCFGAADNFSFPLGVADTCGRMGGLIPHSRTLSWSLHCGLNHSFEL